MNARFAALSAASLTLLAVRASSPPDPLQVLAPDAALTSIVGGLANTGATSSIVDVTGQPFTKALRVTIGRESTETNATQLTLPNTAPIRKGDVLLATFYLRGKAKSGSPCGVEFLFERATSPWTKSISSSAVAAKDPAAWKRFSVPFAAAESYQPGQAMASFRLAFGPQTVELGGVSLVDYGDSKKLSDLTEDAVNPLGSVSVTVNLKNTRQTLLGFGGDFCAPRYGATEPFDAVARYNLRNLNVTLGRVGLPLEKWAPEPGVTREEGQARACLLQMQEIKRRKLPLIVSVWEGPQWLLPGRPESNGRTLPPDRYDDCIEAIGKFLITARDNYGATADYFSFNEADMGINFRFTPAQIAAFIRKAGPHFKQLGLPTKFLVGDTGNGAGFVRYAPPLLEDRTLAPYLGPAAFHCWDVVGASDATYEQIGAIARKYNKPLWCTEAGHDAGLWQRPNPWPSWENALRTALAYEKTLRLTGASTMLYWTYEDDFPLTTKDGSRPYPVWEVIKQMEDGLPAGWRVATATSGADELHALPAVSLNGSGFSLLLVNTAGPGRATIDGLPASTRVLLITSTNSAQRQQTAVRVGPTGRITIPIPARSVVTLQTR